VDDEPPTRDELFTAMAQSVGKPRLHRLPGAVVRLFAGVATDMLSRSWRVSNRRFQTITGWMPTVPNARIGWARIANAERESGTVGSPVHARQSRPTPR